MMEKNEMRPKLAEDLSELPILVAEDDDTNFRLMEFILRPKKVVRAKNGQEAVEMVKNQKFSMVLMDIRMPVMNGIEATRLIREFNKEIPIIAASAYAKDERGLEMREAGCNVFLAKPINKDKIAEVLATD